MVSLNMCKDFMVSLSSKQNMTHGTSTAGSLVQLVLLNVFLNHWKVGERDIANMTVPAVSGSSDQIDLSLTNLQQQVKESLRRPPEATVTMLTAVGILGLVRSTVGRQVVAPEEGLAADVTHKGTFIQMGVHVRLQLVAAVELLVAHLALRVLASAAGGTPTPVSRRQVVRHSHGPERFRVDHHRSGRRRGGVGAGLVHIEPFVMRDFWGSRRHHGVGEERNRRGRVYVWLILVRELRGVALDRCRRRRRIRVLTEPRRRGKTAALAGRRRRPQHVHDVEGQHRQRRGGQRHRFAALEIGDIRAEEIEPIWQGSDRGLGISGILLGCISKVCGVGGHGSRFTGVLGHTVMTGGCISGLCTLQDLRLLLEPVTSTLYLSFGNHMQKSSTPE